MISAPRVCPKCGTEIPSDAPEGSCTFCLLQAAIGSEQTVHDSTPAAGEGAMRFGVYEIDCHADGSLYELGRGAMGITYRATDTTLQRKVALKIIKSDLAERSADARERFMREARAAAALRHENIAVIHQFGMSLETGRYFYAMELIEGETLDERIHRAGPLDARSTIQIAQQVASALAAAEEHGLVHRDLKPANLMLVSASNKTSANKGLLVKIIDFGLAKAIHTATDPKSLTHDRFVGTPAFASPEQFEHSALDVRSDIYSLGETLWFALTGKTPFAGRSVEEIHRAQKSNVLPVEQLKTAHVPHRLKSLLESMLSFEPASRPGTNELGARLQRCSPEVRSVRRTRFGLAAASFIVLGLSAAIIFLWERTQNSIPKLEAPDKSIALLPFENRSEDKANAYFADGIQDEILTRLSNIADLRVISRTSTRQYQSKPANLREIAKQLGVANILEGSVQKVGDQVRVNVQLINSQTDSHLWADTYDRKLTDIFAVESEIAKGIAESLQAKLTSREEQALAVKPTNNPEAYDAYLRGLAFETRPGSSIDRLLEAGGFYNHAVELDPNFALAWARLSRVDALLCFFRLEAPAPRREAAKHALENAQRLAPDSSDTLLALGYYQFWGLRDYPSAKTTFQRVIKMLPSSSEVPMALGLIARREGNWDQSVTYYDQALALDPRNELLLMRAVVPYTELRQFTAALKLYDRVLDIMPNDLDAMAGKAGIYQSEGNLQEAAKYLSGTNETPSAFGTKTLQLRLERNYSEAVRLLQVRQAQFHYDSQFFKASDQVQLALMQRLAGDTTGAKVTAEEARNTLEQLYRDQPDADFIAARLSQAYSAMGKKDSALREAQRAIMLGTRAKDPVYRPSVDENLAIIQTMFGENSSAISTLKQLLQTPYNSWVYGTPITPALLRLDPIWDPLRNDPAFQKLCEEKIDKSIAVLPFENLSEDKANAYFADGIQDEILTRLAKIGDLKAISRTSTQHYKSAPENLPEIAKQLGIAHILQGRVQRSGDSVRVSVQLINAMDDSQLWAETFDRKLVDVFSVESEVAKAIADQLQAKLTGREEQALAVKPTNNPEAYDAYLRGLALEARTSTGVEKAIPFFERAVQLDPAFAVAWARLSRANAQVYLSGLDVTSTRRDAAERALNTAQKLQPSSPETLLAQAYYQYWVLRDYELAKGTFGRVRELLPSSSDVPGALALIARRQGHWDESVVYLEQTLALDPRSTEWLANAAETYAMLRQFPAALKTYDRLLDIVPNDPDTIGSEAKIYQAEGNLEQAGKLLFGVNAQTPSRIAFLAKMEQLFLERHFDEAIRLIHNRLTESRDLTHVERLVNPSFLALAQQYAGDIVGARGTAQQMLGPIETLCQKDPDNPNFAQVLSLIHAVLGQKDAAIREAERAITLLPSGKDAVDGPTGEENLAFVEVLVGDKNGAIPRLHHLLEIPYAGCLTPSLLRLHPQWDPLRSEPTFQKLCEEKQP